MDMYRYMSCGHQLRFWSPLEGTAHGALAFQKEPEVHGFCEKCRAIRDEREACAKLAESWAPEAYHAEGIAAAIRARGKS